MLLVALQVGLQPLVTRKCVDECVSTKSLVLAENAVTAVMSLSTLYLTVPDAFGGWTLWDSIRLAGPPAVVYAIRSLLKNSAYRNCDGVTFNIINQTKTVFCAISAWLLIGETQTFQQCTALLCAVAAGALLILPQRHARSGSSPTVTTHAAESTPKVLGNEAASKQTLTVSGSSSFGVILAAATAVCSGFAAALSQMAFRSAGNRPSTLFTFELALWGAPFAILLGGAGGGGTKDNETPQGFSIIRGWRLRTLTPVALQAAGGILVGVVVKQHGGVAMGLCTIIGIVVSAIADAAVTRRPPSARQFFAASLAASSIIAHQVPQ